MNAWRFLLHWAWHCLVNTKFLLVVLFGVKNMEAVCPLLDVVAAPCSAPGQALFCVLLERYIVHQWKIRDRFLFSKWGDRFPTSSAYVSHIFVPDSDPFWSTWDISPHEAVRGTKPQNFAWGGRYEHLKALEALLLRDWWSKSQALLQIPECTIQWLSFVCLPWVPAPVLSPKSFC